MKKLLLFSLFAFILVSFTGSPYSGKPFDCYIHNVFIRDVDNNVVTSNYYLFIQTGHKYYVYDASKYPKDFIVPIDSTSRMAFGYPRDKGKNACSFEIKELYKFMNGSGEFEIGISVLANEGKGSVNTLKKGINFDKEDFSADMKKFPVANKPDSKSIASIAFFDNTESSQRASRNYVQMEAR